MRTLAFGGAGAVLAACTSKSPHPSPSAPVPRRSGPAGGTSAHPALLPRTTAWRARHGEVAPDVKGRAVALVEAAGAWKAGQGGPRAARRRIAALGLDPGLADQLGPLLPAAGAAAVQIVDAQYGGILANRASVLVVVDQWLLRPDGTVHSGGTTLDIRLVAASPRWRVTEVHPAAPGPAARSLSATAHGVLGNARVHLPYAASADIRAGRVHDSVLHALTALSRTYVLDVSVIRSGHPYLVFGTDRPSDHPHGRAADVWAIDGRPVVDPANRRLVERYMRAAANVGPWQVGGPVDLGGSEFFSDATHQDHVHMGFRT